MSYVLDAMSILLDEKYTLGTIRDPDDPEDKPKADIKSRVSSFVNSSPALSTIHSSASKFMHGVKEHHKSIIAGAITGALSHVAHIDMPGDLEQHVHHHIEHLSTNLGISKTLAHGMLTHAVGKLKEMRGIKEDQEKDEDIDRALVRLHKMLKKLEPYYSPPKEEPKPKPKGEPK